MVTAGIFTSWNTRRKNMIKTREFYQAVKDNDYVVSDEICERFKDVAPQSFFDAAKAVARETLIDMIANFLQKGEENDEGLKRAESRADKKASVPYPHGRYTQRTDSSLPVGDRD
jgi:hypothetical protein